MAAWDPTIILEIVAGRQQAEHEASVPPDICPLDTPPDFFRAFVYSWKESQHRTRPTTDRNHPIHTVDGRNLAPVDR